MKTTPLRFVGAAAALVLLAACSNSPGTTSGGNSPSANDKLTIGVSFDQLHETRQAELDAIKAAAKEKGDTVVFVSADNDAQKQSTQIQDLIQTKKVDAVIVIAWNKDQINSSIALAKAKKVPFIAMDRAVADEVNIAYQVTGDPVADGKLAGKQMLDSGKDLKVLHLLGALTDQNAVGRRDGFIEALKGQSKVQIVAEVATEWDPVKALDGVSNALQKNPGINAIYVPSDYLLPSVESALKSAGRAAIVGDAAHVFVVTNDGDPNGCKAMVAKSIDADITTAIATFGATSVKAAHTAVAGGTVDPKIVKLVGFPFTQANFADTKAKVWGCQK